MVDLQALEGSKVLAALLVAMGDDEAVKAASRAVVVNAADRAAREEW